MKLFSPFSILKSNNTKLFDNSTRVARILYRFNSYRKLFFHALEKGVHASDLVRSQFPFLLKDAIHPPIVSLELTNHCNLKCPYCTSPLGQVPRGMMDNDVFTKVISDLSEIRTNRIQIVGNGESTLHPQFGKYISQLAKTGKYISLVTNGQWTRDSVSDEICNASIDLVDFSIDAGGKEGYEKSRINGRYETVLSNVISLKEKIKQKKVRTIINIRVMTRPSQMPLFEKEKLFWKKYADRVMPQYVTKINNTTYEEDVFIPIQNKNKTYPKCSMPFKHIEVKWNGDILMCYYTVYQLRYPGLKMGNVLEQSILKLWNCQIMREYREAHRNCVENKMPVCLGCPGT